MIGREASRPGQGGSVGSRQRGAHQPAGDTVGGEGVMAAEAGLGPAQEGLVGRLLIHLIEDRALLGILRGDLEHEGAADPGDGHRVVEVNHPRIPRIDQVQLRAGLGEDRDLRLNRDLQRLEQGSQVAVGVVRRQLKIAEFDLAIQCGDRIPSGPGRVLDRRMIQLFEARVAKLGGSNAGNRQQRGRGDEPETGASASTDTIRCSAGHNAQGSRLLLEHGRRQVAK